jgi:hypothetical protein
LVKEIGDQGQADNDHSRGNSVSCRDTQAGEEPDDTTMGQRLAGEDENSGP